MIQRFPAGSCVKISEEVYLFMLMQVPPGRLTRWKDIEAFLARKFGVHHIEEFDRVPMSIRNIKYSHNGREYIALFSKFIPAHREVSAIGYLEGPLDQAEKLISEGFTVVQKGAYNKSAVKDYKKYLFDFDKEANISLEILQDIDQNGLMKYFV